MKPPHTNRPGGRPGGGHGQGPRGPGGPPRPAQGGAPGQARRNGAERDFRPRQHGSGPRPHGQAHPHGPHPQHAPRPPEAPRGSLWIYGLHAVSAALGNPARRLRRLLLTEEAESALARRRPPPWALQAERVDRGRLDHLLGRDVVHQGAALLADPLPTPSLQQALERPGPLLVLDQVTDPRNVGAILRSAAAFGAAAVITQDRNAPEETGALAKAASGALETMPLLRAINIARTLVALKAANIWTVGLDAGAPPLCGAALAGRRVALVLGAEGEGLRRLTRETCDELAGLAMPGAMDSINVSAAATVALYELSRRA
ncbi:MAG TPA: RNA methyltransferase [Acetobacteraceae bacterium]|nr:RNA methyltransferase [Acetobacteraceae bacterium]